MIKYATDLSQYYISKKQFIEDGMLVFLSTVANNQIAKVLTLNKVAGFIDYPSQEQLGELQVKSSLGSYAYHVVAVQCNKPNVDDYKEIFIWNSNGAYVLKAAAQEVDLVDYNPEAHA